MSAKHTPGPWRTSLSDDTVVIHIDAKGVHHEVANIDGDYNEPDLWPIMEANTRLIASAPDLLSALRWLRAFWHPGSNHDTDEVQCALASADAAIARATGAA